MASSPIRAPSQTGKRLAEALCFIAFLWIAGIVYGGRRLLNYENTASQRASGPTMWPRASKIPRTAGMATVVVVAHPKCPCTRATIGELALLMTRLHSQATAAVVFIRPEGTPAGWEQTGLWRSAARIPGVTVLADPDNREADLFGALASGQTFLYDANGQLKFSGGITVARGHSGDNAGRSSIVALVTGQGVAQKQTSVFGCSLHKPEVDEIQEAPHEPQP